VVAFNGENMDMQKEEGVFRIIEYVCGEKMEDESIGKTTCALIDSYDPLCQECCCQNCPARKDIENILKDVLVPHPQDSAPGGTEVCCG
jgi:hypothetical protein